MALAAPSVRGEPSPSAGETAPPPLTLSESLRQALQHNPSLRSAESSLRQSEARRDEAEAPLRPRLDLSAEGGPQEFSGRPETALALSLSYGQTVGRPEDVRLRLRRAELAPQVARLSLEQVRTSVVAEVQSAFLAVVEAQSAADLGQLQLKAAQEAARVARERYAAGVLAQADLLAAQAAEARARQAALAASQALQLAYESLYRVMGVPMPASPPPVQAPPLEGLQAPSEDPDALRRRALESRPEVLSALAAVSDAELALRQAQRSSLPTLQLKASYQWTNPLRGLTLSVDDETNVRFTVFQQQPAGQAFPGYSVGIGLVWHLADGGLSGAQVRQAQEALEQARLQVEKVQASVVAELAQRQADLARALQELLVAEQALAEATARYEAVRQQAAAGLATDLDLLQAEARLAQARHDRLRSLIQVARARTALAVASGTSSAELLQRLAGPQGEPSAQRQGS